MDKKTIVLTLVKTVWQNTNTIKVGKVVLFGKGSNMAQMPCILGEFGILTLHGAN